MEPDCIEFIDFFGERPESNNLTLSLVGWWWDNEKYIYTDKNINSTRYDCNTDNEALETIYTYKSTLLIN